MNTNKKYLSRKSLRLKGYDYSRNGAYFITICTNNKKCLFGETKEGKMFLNSIGKMVEKWWVELENKFPIKTDKFIVMPNHFHGILFIFELGIVGAGSPSPLCVKPEGKDIVGVDLCVNPKNRTGRHAGLPLQNGKIPLSRMVQWFKTMTTNEYFRNVKTNGKLWQRNFYEHIISYEEELDEIRAYIVENPLKWELDAENPNRKGINTEVGDGSTSLLCINPKGKDIVGVDLCVNPKVDAGFTGML